MKFCQQIPNKQTVKMAMKLIKMAKTEIVMTMDVNEETKKPLPQKYHDLITQRVKEGIKVTRYAFGNKKTFMELAQKYPEVICRYCKNKSSYQRMLVVDRKRALFAVDDTKAYTEFPELINSLLHYIEIIYNRR